MLMVKQEMEQVYILKFPTDFFIEKIEVTGHSHDNSEICIGMIFLPRNDYGAQEACQNNC